MAPPSKLMAEKCIDDGRFCYPPDLQEKVNAYRRARKLSALIQDAIRRAPWPEEKEGDKNMPYGFSERMTEAAEEQFFQEGRVCCKCGAESTPENPITWGPARMQKKLMGMTLLYGSARTAAMRALMIYRGRGSGFASKVKRLQLKSG